MFVEILHFYQGQRRGRGRGKGKGKGKGRDFARSKVVRKSPERAATFEAQKVKLASSIKSIPIPDSLCLIPLIIWGTV